MHKSMLCGHTDCPNTIYSTFMPQNLPFFKTNRRKIAIFFIKDCLFFLA